jgi:hypothetical protein
MFPRDLEGTHHLLVYSSPDELRRAIAEFIEFYKFRRYPEGIGNLALTDVYYGPREGNFERSKKQKRVTLEERFRYNRSRSKETTMGALSPKKQLLTAPSYSERCCRRTASGSARHGAQMPSLLSPGLPSAREV